MAGRPSKYSDEVADAICEAISQGQSLRAICDDDDLPAYRTVMGWLQTNEEFSHNYARAREEQADHFADEIIEIADAAEDPQVAKLRIDARKWKASRMAPRKYGDRIMQEHSGGDGGPLQVNIVRFSDPPAE